MLHFFLRFSPWSYKDIMYFCIFCDCSLRNDYSALVVNHIPNNTIKVYGISLMDY